MFKKLGLLAFVTSASIATPLPLTAQPVDAWDFLEVKAQGDMFEPSLYTIQEYNSLDGTIKQIATKKFGGATIGLKSGPPQFSAVDQRFYFGTTTGTYYYDLTNNEWGKSSTMNISGGLTTNSSQYISRQLAVGNSTDNCTSVGVGDGKITICPPTTSKPKGVYVDNNPLIGKMSTGEIHIGENSLITIEENGVQKLYAQDADGKAIPIDITEGSDLLIDGVSVKDTLDSLTPDIPNDGVKAVKTAVLRNKDNIEENRQNIEDLGFGVAGATALSTAMSALPTIAQDSPLSCGVGTGGYSSRFAMSVGCAVKANDRLSINAGGSYVFGGAADYGNGSLSTAAARAGFVFKFGNLDTPAASNEQLQSQLDEVQEENSSIREENASIRDENASIKEQNQELLARLERLEAIALGNQPADTAVSLK
jgi:hypothetical protein